MIRLAILPGIILFWMVYKNDKIEKEPFGLLLKLFIGGTLSIIPAIIIGTFGEDIVTGFLSTESFLFLLIDNFLLTALVEEGGKYFVLKKCTWKDPAFNYTFDAVVYAVTASLGFAIPENILYLIDADITVGIMRALLSVPGHVIDAVFMGLYYGQAKLCYVRGDQEGKRSNLRKALLIPMMLHGFYDFCLSTEETFFIVLFLVYEIIMTVIAAKKVKQLSKEDTPI